MGDRAPPPRDARLPGPTDALVSVAWSPDGRHIAAGSSDDTVWIWDSRTRKPALGSPERTRAPQDRVKAVAWDPKGTDS
ncbi:WD40 repeat domain-containing protein [Streptomyces sp. NPDC002851]